jgi:hypothetical protein
VWYRGHCGTDKELWIERMIKATKFFVRGRGSREPEIVVLHAYLVLMALQYFKLLHRLRDFSQLAPYWRTKQDYARTEMGGGLVGDDVES